MATRLTSRFYYPCTKAKDLPVYLVNHTPALWSPARASSQNLAWLLR